MVKSFLLAIAFVTILVVGALFFLPHPLLTNLTQNTQQLQPSQLIAEADPSATSTLEWLLIDSPLPTPTDVPTPAPSPTPLPYPDLKIASIEPVKTGPYLNLLRSPDGTKVLVSKHEPTKHILVRSEQSLTDVGLRDLWLIDEESGKETLLMEQVGRYDWSPDSAKFAMVNPTQSEGIDGELVIYDIASNQAKSIAQADFLGSDYKPQWLSADEIVFVREGNLWVIQSDGINERLLANFKFVSESRESNKILHQDDVDALIQFDFSPDGKRIAYFTRHESMRAIVNKLWIANADGSAPHLITGQAFGFSWSPDNQWLEIITFRDIKESKIDERQVDPERHIWLLRMDTFEPILLRSFMEWGGVGRAEWSLDSKRMVFVVRIVQERGLTPFIWIADVSPTGKIGTLAYPNVEKSLELAVWWNQRGDGLIAAGEMTPENGSEFYTELLKLTQ